MRVCNGIMFKLPSSQVLDLKLLQTRDFPSLTLELVAFAIFALLPAETMFARDTICSISQEYIVLLACCMYHYDLPSLLITFMGYVIWA